MNHKSTRLALSPLVYCVLGVACAQQAPQGAEHALQLGEPDLATLQRQIQDMRREVQSQREQIAHLQQQVVRLQLAQRGGSYPTDLVRAQRVQGSLIAGLARQPSDGPGPGLGSWGNPVLVSEADSSGSASASAPAVGSGRQAAADEVQHSSTEVAAQGHAPLFHHRFTLTAGWNYTHYDRRQLALSGFLALDAIFLGNISINQTKADIQTFDLAGQYGLTDDLAFDFDIPYVVRHSTFISGGQGFAANALSQAGVSSRDMGDVSFGLDDRLVRDHDAWPDIVGILKITAPTGSSPFGIAVLQPDAQNTNLQVPARLPTGNGVWSVNAGLSFLKTSDPVVLFGNIGYIYNLPKSVAVVDPASINGPGTVKLGDGFQLGGGFALVLNDKTSISTSVLTLITRSTEVKLPGQGYQTVAGSAGNNTSLAFGLNYALSPRLTLSATLQAGLTPDAPNYALSLRFPYTF